MKKVIFTLFSFSMLYFGANAQYCGNSGPSVCTPSGTLTQPGLSPASDSLAPVVNGVDANTTIQFKNFNQFVFGGQTVTVNSLKIDTISNLPAGTCWATNVANNTFANQADGCIKVTGTVCSDPGQYKLYIVVTADIGFPVQTNADAAGLKYFVRVKNSGDADVAVDTNQTASFNKLAGYSATAQGGNCNLAIKDITSINALSVVPNPFNDKAVVSFYSSKGGVMTEKITNMIGSEVYSNTIEVKVGENSSVIAKNTLPAGVYFYSLADGKNISTKRIVISE
ncbi:MAG: T9SS type A sorting domain-containing protein [Chitinophagales bacterium]